MTKTWKRKAEVDLKAKIPKEIIIYRRTLLYD